jgi:hypothetical protein
VLTGSQVLGVRGINVDTVVCVGGDSRVEVHNSEFSWNRARPLFVFGRAHLLLNASTILGNFVQGSGDASILDSRSVQGFGGGIKVSDGAAVTITGQSRVHGNNATAHGGGLFAGDNATLKIEGNSSVSGNSAGQTGGGLAAANRASVTLTGGSNVDGNVAKDRGGGINVGSMANVTLSGGSSVYNNTAGDKGGGLALWFDARVTITGRSTVHGNSAKTGGGLMGEQHVNVTVSGGSSVFDNVARNGSGGGLDVGFYSKLVLSGGSRVYNNRVLNGSGGGLGIIRGVQAFISDQTYIVNNTCSGVVGGGIAVDVASDATFDARGRFSRASNELAGSGSGVRFPSYLMINSSTVANNTCIGSAGGGLAVGSNGTVELVNGSVLSHNMAVSGSGGGAVLFISGTLRADDSVMVVNNSVSQGFVGSTIAAFANSTLDVPLRGSLTRCSAGVYLGLTIASCLPGEGLQYDVCMCCPRHTFSFTNNSNCELCPRNGNCTGGSLVEPLSGYWSSAPTSVQMHRCPLSTTACNHTGPNKQCNEGYTGPLCGACSLPSYGMLSPFRCGKCMLPKIQLGLYMLLCFVSVFFVTYTVHATWKDNLVGDKAVLATDLIKVLVLFLQCTVIIGSVAVPWPIFDVQRWFQAVNIVFAVGSGQALFLDCWLYHYIPQGKLPLAMQRQLVYFLAPLLVLVVVMALECMAWAVVRWVVQLVWQPKKSNMRQSATSPALLVLRKLPVTLLVVAFYAYPTLLRASLGFFACLRIDSIPPAVQLPPGATAPLNHTAGYWISDIQQQCFTGNHKSWALGLGLPSAVLWCFAVPVAMGVGLFMCRAKADSYSFREHFGFLYRCYRPECMWWEAVWAARTVMLTLISVMSVPMERYYAVLSLLVVFLVSAALQIYFQPYAFAKLHRMHLVSTSCLAVTTLGALAMFGYDIQEPTALQLRIAIAVLVLVVNILFVGWCSLKLVPAVKGWCDVLPSCIKTWGPRVQRVLACNRQPAASDAAGLPKSRCEGDSV